MFVSKAYEQIIGKTSSQFIYSSETLIRECVERIAFGSRSISRQATSPASQHHNSSHHYRRGSMTNLLRTRTAIAAITGLAGLGALAGCSATPAASTDASSGGNAPATTTSNASYKDGTYTEPGTYDSPGGSEHISVTLTLSKNVITALKVITVKADPTAAAYERMFEGGIAAATVGKNINTLNIGVVAGSSLTSMGFNQALATIKADAAS
jgi:uncharacterized protein with FMN-binding domain